MDQCLLLLTTLTCHWRPLERAPLLSPVTLNYPPAAGHKITMAALLSEDGQDQAETFPTHQIRTVLAEGSSEVAGTYCCQVPRESGATTTHCVMVTGEWG